MQAIRSRDTGPEAAVRRLLHGQGFRYRVNYRPQQAPRRTIDIAFTGIRVAVFIDGCFWHGCPKHYRPPTRNESYWTPKIERNRLRDLETTTTLSGQGWTVLRFWTHLDPAAIAAVVASEVRLRSASAR
jgi:DNA mismatch endonuclease (patch repair protein)